MPVSGPDDDLLLVQVVSERTADDDKRPRVTGKVSVPSRSAEVCAGTVSGPDAPKAWGAKAGPEVSSLRESVGWGCWARHGQVR